MVDDTTRRCLLSSIVAATGVGLAGCVGGDGENGENGSDGGGGEGGEGGLGENGDWPPPRNLVEIVHDSTPGGGPDLLARGWSEFMSENMEGDIDVSITAQNAGNGIVAANDAYRADPNGGLMFLQSANATAINYVGNPSSEYQPEEFRTLGTWRTINRGIQISHHDHTPNAPNDHWEWTWDDFVEVAPELNFGISNASIRFMYELIEELEPRFDDGDLNLIDFGGGGELRSAILQGNADVHGGGFASNYEDERADEYYYTQFVMVDDRYPEWGEKVQQVDENATLIGDTDFEGAETVVDASLDAYLTHLPPDTPDDIYNRFIEIHEQGATDEELEETIADLVGEFDHNVTVGEEAQELIPSAVDTMEEYEDLLPEL